MSSGSWARERRFVMPRLLPRRLRSLHTLVLVLVLLLCGWGGWLWYRSSSFVKVERVSVLGLSGPDIPQIRGSLTRAARQMTTLDMDIPKLEAAVSRYPFVKALTVTHSGAHRVVIRVAEQVPVAVVEAGGSRQVVDAAGQLLPSTATPDSRLPLVPLRSAPAGTAITAPGARAAVAVLAAAPYRLLGHIQSATSSGAHGVVVQLRDGPQLYFGLATQLAQKWNAAVAVLQDKSSAGASYIDVSDPQRPAAGVGVSTTQAQSLGLTTAQSATTSTESSGAAGSTENPQSGTG